MPILDVGGTNIFLFIFQHVIISNTAMALSPNKNPRQICEVQFTIPQVICITLHTKEMFVAEYTLRRERING
jgi:hypothetical protein